MNRSLLLAIAFVAFVGLCSCKKQEPSANPQPAPGQPQQPQPPENTPPTPKATGLLQPTKTFKVDVVDVTAFSLAHDGSTVGLAARGKLKDGGEVEHISAFYDLNSGNRVGVPIKLYGPGTISNGGKTSAYFDSPKVFVHDITTGQQAEAVQVYSDGFFAYAPDGKLFVTSDKTKLTFRPWPASGEPLEVDAKSPIIGLSQVFLQGTRVAAIHDDEKGVVVRVWDVKTGKPVDEVPLNRPTKTKVNRFGPILVAEDGKAMVVRWAEGDDELWDLNAKKQVKWADTAKFTSFQPVTGSQVCYKHSEIKIEGDGAKTTEFIAVADLQTGNVVHKLVFPVEVRGSLGVYFDSAADGKRFVAVCDDTRKVYIWDLPK